MKQKRQFAAIINREENGYVSLCPELDIASQGNTVEEARNNLVEALELFFEVAEVTNAAEIKRRLQGLRLEVSRVRQIGIALIEVWRIDGTASTEAIRGATGAAGNSSGCYLARI
jgi:predicted RNase H-like HicB family nuclease